MKKQSLLVITCVGAILFGLARADARDPITQKPANWRQRVFGVPHSPEVIRTVQLAKSLSVNARHGLVLNVMRRQATMLPIHSAFRLTDTMYLSPDRDAAHSIYMRANSPWLTAREAIRIADKMLLGLPREAALVSFATENKHRLSAKDQRMIAAKLLDPRNRDTLMYYAAGLK